MRYGLVPALVFTLGCSLVNAPAEPTPGAGGGGTTGSGGGTGGSACELGTLTDCTACGEPCLPVHVQTPACTDGVCGFDSCINGFLDCDGEAANGCEVAGATDPAHCGTCDIVCDGDVIANATLACVDGDCDYETCEATFGDCDGDRTNGCETTLGTIVNCAACGDACSPANVDAPTCGPGGCAYSQCAGGFKDCDGDTANGCESPSNDPLNCGACGTPCMGGQVCNGVGCSGFRPNLMLCGTSGRNLLDFVPQGTSFNVLNGCNPDGSVQALFVTRDFIGLTAAAVQNYLLNGGVVITEHNISDEVFGLAFVPVAQGPSFIGSCVDTIPMVVQFSGGDPFWQNNPFVQMPIGETGCGFSISGFPGVTPLSGWDAANIALGYRDLGAGRLWLCDVDWQDGQDALFTPQTKSMMGYMLTHPK